MTSEYLVSAREIQIKMAQGAKPGEGGQLPGHKVYPWIAKVRHSTPGVGLISPPPHHDIYSIEDLAELIHDLKNANPDARISVKLVSEVGVGTIAAGVAKAHADVILISGHDGGTGASPLASIKHAGLPWELGLAETNQVLLINDLRSRVAVEVDGQMKTGRDVVIGALLGAEEFGFSTAPLVTLGCVMMRVCHLNTCPVGIATQDPELRKRFTGDPQYVVNFMTFVAQEVRELHGRARLPDLRGDGRPLRAARDAPRDRPLEGPQPRLQPDPLPAPGAQDDPSDLPDRPGAQDRGVARRHDAHPALRAGAGARREGRSGPADPQHQPRRRHLARLRGHAPLRRRRPARGHDQAPLPRLGRPELRRLRAQRHHPHPGGRRQRLPGQGPFGRQDRPVPADATSTFVAEENVITGNVAFYGATSGEAYIRGMAGERFCVRNSGVSAVVEGVGDHGCEYMTGGRVVVIGKTGRNFAAGMSGGVAYVLDESGEGGAAGGGFERVCNKEMVQLFPLSDPREIAEIRRLLERHVEYTASPRAQALLDDWDTTVSRFIRVVPNDYRRVIEAQARMREKGLSQDEAEMAAFDENVLDARRVAGN